MEVLPPNPPHEPKHRLTKLCNLTGTEFWAAVNTRFERVAASSPRKENIERFIWFEEQYVPPTEVDPDWIPGSSRNWWARNREMDRSMGTW